MAIKTMPANDSAGHDDRAFLGQPKALGYLAFTEAWERFSYYGMQSLLALYLVKHLLLPGNAGNVVFFDDFRRLYGNVDGQPLASEIVGTYFACVYLTPIIGGFLADRVLGKHRTVLLGAVTMAAGHFLMAFEASFLFALLCLILGSGMFKGNIASQVGSLYKMEDLRRADAFQLFYLGINAGVIAAPLVVGTLAETQGWHYGFGAAGVGMLIALAIYVLGRKYLPAEHFTIGGKADRLAHAPFSRADRSAVIALLLLVPTLAIGVVPNNQIFNAYLVWGDQQFDLVFWGKRLPTTWLVTLDAILSVSFLGGVALFYRWYGKHHREPDELAKLIIGSGFSIAGMFCLYMAAETQTPGAKIGLYWPVAFHMLNSIAFAHMLPISLALFSRIAPKSINATVIGLYYLAFFIGNSLVGWIGGFYSSMRTTDFWLLHAGLAASAGMVFLLLKLLLISRLASAAVTE